MTRLDLCDRMRIWINSNLREFKYTVGGDCELIKNIRLGVS